MADIVFECDASLKKEPLRRFGPGRVRLKADSLEWQSALPAVVRFLQYRAPLKVMLPLASVSMVQTVREGRRAWLMMTVGPDRYALRPGRGLWLLKQNAEVTEVLFDAIVRRKGTGVVDD